MAQRTEGSQNDFASEQRLAQSPPNVLSISAALRLSLWLENRLSKVAYTQSSFRKKENIFKEL